MYTMTKKQFTTRVKSWLWRAAMVALVSGVDALLATYTNVQIPGFIGIGIGLALAEVSKFLHNKYSEN